MKGNTDGLFQQYRGLIGYAAQMYSRRSKVIDPDDMFQDGCLLMLEFFRDRTETTDERVHNTFKKSLFLWMQRTVRRRIKQAHPTGKALVRMDYMTGEENNLGNDMYDHEPMCIQLDEILASVDTCVLTKMYAREFVAELRRVLRGADLTIFELIVDSVDTNDSRGEVVRRAAAMTGIAVPTVYTRMTRIRDAAVRALSRSA